MSAFTKDFRRITPILNVFAQVTNPSTGECRTYRAIFDTGADTSVISQKVVDDLHITLDGKIRVGTMSNKVDVRQAYVDISFYGVAFSNLKVIACVTSTVDVIIGMDIITQGDLTITNSNGSTRLSFSVPSDENNIDAFTLSDTVYMPRQ